MCSSSIFCAGGGRPAGRMRNGRPAGTPRSENMGRREGFRSAVRSGSGGAARAQVAENKKTTRRFLSETAGYSFTFCMTSGQLSLCRCSYRTYASASSAADALVLIDYVCSVSLGDSLYRALCLASSAADASSVINLISHWYYLLVKTRYLCILWIIAERIELVK